MYYQYVRNQVCVGVALRFLGIPQEFEIRVYIIPGNPVKS